MNSLPAYALKFSLARDRFGLFAAALICFCFGCPEALGQGRLDRIRDDVDRDPRPMLDEQEHEKQDRESLDDTEEEDRPFGEQLFVSFLTSIFSNDETETDQLQPASVSSRDKPTKLARYESSLGKREYYFAHYPYADGLQGYVMDEGNVLARPQTGALRARFYYSTDFDDIEMWHADGTIQWNNGFSVDGQIDYLLEALPTGFEDNLTIGDINATIRLWARPKSLLRGGLGLNWLADQGSLDTGINSTLVWDWFPAEPVTISSQVDFGKVGSADTLHLESTLGWSWDHLEIFGGYNYRRIAGVDLAGPIFGIRGWW